jgi:hypothetical protein
MTMTNETAGHNELVMEYRVTKFFLTAALELGLNQASIILGDREAALRQAIEPKPKKVA